MITRGQRRVSINQTVFDQADFFQNDGFTRQAGLTLVDLASQLFFNNVLQPWTLTDGAPVPDSHTRAGSIYFNEITGATGHYSVRLRPSASGYWRLVLVYAVGQQILTRDYDVSAET